jgi:Spy/CpxP family protein refolding chaperone
MTDKPWKLVLLLAGIFAAGAVTGGFATLRFGRPRAPRPRMENWREDRLKMLADRLDLTAEQQEKLRPIIKPYAEELNRIRTLSISDTRKVLDRLEHDVAAVLTPEQRTKFDELNREQRERMQRFTRDRGPGGAMRPPHDQGPGEPPPGPPPDRPADKPPGG